MAFLCISLNNSSVDAIHLLDGDLIDIDKYTTKFDGARSILKQYPEKIKELNSFYNLDNTIHNIKVRIFLANDKEQFVMYQKHLIAFKVLITNRAFLRYAIIYQNNLFSKMEREVINDDEISEKETYKVLKEYIEDIGENDYFELVRNICAQYLNYREDFREKNPPSIEDISKEYLLRLKNSKLSRQNKVIKVKKKETFNPFAVFQHPNFFKTYGQSIDNTKPIFILGGKMTDNTKFEYQELYDNCSNCFNNPIYYPLNFNVSSPFSLEYINLYDNSLLIVINANDYNDNLVEKINRAREKSITVLILVNNERLKQVYETEYQDSETIVIKDYFYGDSMAKKTFADIAVGLYINAYKKKKVVR